MLSWYKLNKLLLFYLCYKANKLFFSVKLKFFFKTFVWFELIILPISLPNLKCIWTWIFTCICSCIFTCTRNCTCTWTYSCFVSAPSPEPAPSPAPTPTPAPAPAPAYLPAGVPAPGELSCQTPAAQEGGQAHTQLQEQSLQVQEHSCLEWKCFLKIFRIHIWFFGANTNV